MGQSRQKIVSLSAPFCFGFDIDYAQEFNLLPKALTLLSAKIVGPLKSLGTSLSIGSSCRARTTLADGRSGSQCFI